MNDNLFDGVYSNPEKKKEKDKDITKTKEFSINKTVEIEPPKPKSLKKPNKYSITINWLEVDDLEKFKFLSKQNKCSDKEMFKYLVNKEWNKYNKK